MKLLQHLNLRRFGVGGFLLAMLAASVFGGPVKAGDNRIVGTPVVVNAWMMIFSGKRVTLANIATVTKPLPCTWRGHRRNCETLASAGLKDLLAGAKVRCTRAGSEGYRCTAGGYDLAYGLIHAGWAVPLKDAPAHYHAKAREAKTKGRGFWSAKTTVGVPVAETLQGR